MNFNRVVFFLLLILVSCMHNSNKFEVSFDNKQKIAEIPFFFSTDGAMITKCIVDKDTLSFLFDTGASTSVINSNYIRNNHSIKKGLYTDTNSYKKEVNIYTIAHMKWGNINIHHLPMIVYNTYIEDVDGIIGADIIKNLITKIDYKNQKILLAKNHKLFSKKGIERNFTSPLFSVNLSKKGFYKNQYFLFDTGFTQEIMIDTIPNKIKSTKWKEEKNGFFKKHYSDTLETNSYFLNDLYLDTTLIKNIVFKYNTDIKRKYIGTVFMRRFQSITIDTQNKKMYFEFPKDNRVMTFSNGESQPISSLNLIYFKLTSFGLEFSDKFPYIISRLELNDINSNFNIGDTLIGVNKTFFFKKGFEQILKNKDNYYEDNFEKQKAILSKIYFQKQKATFHILKNGKILTINIKRKKTQNIPTMGYSFSNNEKSFFSAINLNPLKNFFIHIPYSSVCGEHIAITIYKNGKEQTYNNKPK